MKRFSENNQSGQGLVEYGLILVAVSLVSIGILQVLGVNTADVYCKAVQMFDSDKACSNDALVFDDFSDDSGQWNKLGPRWEEEDEQLCAGSGTHQAFRLDFSGASYTVGVDAMVKGPHGFGLIIQNQSDSRYEGYTFQYDRGYRGGEFVFYRWVNGSPIYPPFARAKPPAGFQWYDVWRHVEVRVEGNTYTAIIDGTPVLSTQHDMYADGGSVGLRTWGPGEVCFDNFRVN